MPNQSDYGYLMLTVKGEIEGPSISHHVEATECNHGEFASSCDKNPKG